MAGRPTEYRDEYVEQVKRLCKIGATDADVAVFFGVSPTTIKAWKHRHEAFNRALRRGKAVADDAVKDSLFRMATGYSIEAEKLFVIDGEVVRESVVEFIAPMPAAAIFWLKNRQGWRDQPADAGKSGNEALADAMLRLAERLPV